MCTGCASGAFFSSHGRRRVKFGGVRCADTGVLPTVTTTTTSTTTTEGQEIITVVTTTTVIKSSSNTIVTVDGEFPPGHISKRVVPKPEVEELLEWERGRKAATSGRPRPSEIMAAAGGASVGKGSEESMEAFMAMASMMGAATGATPRAEFESEKDEVRGEITREVVAVQSQSGCLNALIIKPFSLTIGHSSINNFNCIYLTRLVCALLR